MKSIILTTENLSKRFGGLLALDNLSLEVALGDQMGLIGPNGAGKTTLFNVITGFEKPSSGTVFFKEENISGKTPYEINRLGIGRTFQLVKPFPGLTVLENLMVGLLSDKVIDTTREMGEVETEAHEVCKRIGLLKWKDRMAETLPHGSLKRLEIGRALTTKPEILLLDEPFAGTTGRELEEIIALVQRLKGEGLTLLIVEHKLRALMRLVSKVIVLNFGKKIAEGNPKEIAENKQVQEAYLGSERKTIASS